MINSNLIIPNSTIIIGFSGGPDSIYLLLALQKLKTSHNITLIAAHLDHQWRLKSAQEALWCKQFCDKQNIIFISKKASEIKISQPYNGSQEAYARYLRRDFFEDLQKQYPNSFIALAHHNDDQIETFFIRLARGCSLSGLSGMKEQDGYYIRPLLNLKKTEILKYLNQNNIPYLQDPSNQDLRYLRNRIRINLTQKLPDIDTRLSHNITKIMHHITDTNNLLEQITQNTIDQLSSSNNPYMLITKEFLKIHPILQQRILLKLLIQAKANFTPSKSLFAEIIRFLQSSKSNSHTIHQTYQILKVKNKFYINER